MNLRRRMSFEAMEWPDLLAHVGSGEPVIRAAGKYENGRGKSRILLLAMTCYAVSHMMVMYSLAVSVHARLDSYAAQSGGASGMLHRDEAEVDFSAKSHLLLFGCH